MRSDDVPEPVDRSAELEKPEPRNDELPVESGDEIALRWMGDGDERALPAAQQALAELDHPTPPPSDLEVAKRHRADVRRLRRTNPAFRRAMDEDAAAHRERAGRQDPRPLRPPLRRHMATTLRPRPRANGRPRTSRAARRVSPSRGDPDPPGEPEPPPPPQGRGEDVARSLRTLRAAGPSAGAFAATFGHLPASQQLVAFSMLEPAREAACWADLSRATDREADHLLGALRGAGGRLRSLPIRARLARPDDPWEPHEWPLGLWRLRRMRCHWQEWREGLRVWSWSDRRWEVHDR